MDADRQKWNRRFADKPLTPPKPPGFLLSSIGQLGPGTALELACGDGAGALFLAAHDFKVTTADISEVALSRLQGFASEQGAEITTQSLDLDELDTVRALGRFDNLLAFHFKPSPSLWALLPELLVPDGCLMLSTFNLEHHRRNGFSERFCLSPGEFVDRHPALELLHYQSVERGGDCMDDYLFRRRADD